MKIQVKQPDGRSITIPVPTWLVFNSLMIEIGLKTGRNHSDHVPDIPPEAIDALCREFRRIKQVHGTWELVRMESADGETVIITI